jgi:hypothetical protein
MTALPKLILVLSLAHSGWCGALPVQVPADFPDGAYLRNGPNHPFYEERGDDHIFVRHSLTF